MHVRLTVLAISATIPAASLAAPAPQLSGGDPNEKICENVSQIGSRLSKKSLRDTSRMGRKAAPGPQGRRAYPALDHRIDLRGGEEQCTIHMLDLGGGS